MDDRALTAEEYDEIFGDQHATPPRRRSRRILLVAATIIAGMCVSAAAWFLVNTVRNAGRTNDLTELRAWAAEAVADSEYRDLVREIRFESIVRSETGGYVTNPPNGVIHLDHRSWSQEDLTETVHHEIGHLLDHATRDVLAEPRGGLPTEVFAECAAVAAGARDLDGAGNDDEYRCTPSDYERYLATIATLE